MGPDQTEGSALPLSPEQEVAPDLKTTMQEAMRKLDVKNQELGGRLFAIIGSQDEPESMFYAFPQPNVLKSGPKRSDGGGDFAEEADFLIVTSGGFKVMRINEQNSSFSDAVLKVANQLYSFQIDNQKGISRSLNSGKYLIDHGGSESILLGSDLEISTSRTSGFKLLDPDKESITKIIQLNKERATKAYLEETARKEADVNRLRIQVEIVQGLDELLA